MSLTQILSIEEISYIYLYMDPRLVLMPMSSSVFSWNLLLFYEGKNCLTDLFVRFVSFLDDINRKGLVLDMPPKKILQKA